MITNRILLFGGTGQIGQALQKCDPPADWILAAPSRAECDFTRAGDIGRAIRAFAPDIVINATEMNDLAACEKEPDAAMAVNFSAVATLAGHCDTVNAPLIQLSTSDVFDGTQDTPYRPDDAMNPLNAYGKSKLMGEEAARHGLYWHAIVRTSLVFGADGDNALTQTLHQIDAQDEIQAASDQILNPTSADFVAKALLTMASAILGGKGNGFGTFHVCDEPAVTRYEFLQAIMNAYAPFTNCRPKLVPVTSADSPDPILRPLYAAMNSDKAQRVYGISPRGWREDIAQAIQKFAPQEK